MKTKKFIPVLLFVLLVAAFAVVPVFAQGENPPGTSSTSSPSLDLAYISQLLQLLVLAIAPVLAGWAAKWLSAKAGIEKEKLTAEQMRAFDLFLKTLVYAAEQMKAKEFIDSKIQYVIDHAEAWLAVRKFDIDLDEIRARVEAMVKQEFNTVQK